MSLANPTSMAMRADCSGSMLSSGTGVPPVRAAVGLNTIGLKLSRNTRTNTNNITTQGRDARATGTHPDKARANTCSACARVGGGGGRRQSFSKLNASPRGFTLFEVLATVMLMAIVIPAITRGISVATMAASGSRMRTEASGMAESKLNELLATGEWQNGQSAGDFGTDWPNYRWTSTVFPWQYDTTTAGLQEIDVLVTYRFRNVDQSVTVSALTYMRAQNMGTPGSGSSGSSGTGGTGGAKTGGTGTSGAGTTGARG
jgi:prepilin-type N-terminal cleavage/methylation domain-containing protein